MEKQWAWQRLQLKPLVSDGNLVRYTTKPVAATAWGSGQHVLFSSFHCHDALMRGVAGGQTLRQDVTNPQSDGLPGMRSGV